MNLPRSYDAWRLQGPPEVELLGEYEGEECGRYAGPDEDAPRGYRPRPCTGTMTTEAGVIACDTCGEIPE